MERELIAKNELQQLIQDAISQSTELDGDCRDEAAGTVTWNEVDETGCNWAINYRHGSEACRPVVGRIIDEFQRRYRITDEVP